MKTPSDVMVVGLGYVGLPLALAFASEFETIGFDSDLSRVNQLIEGFDRNLEIDSSLINSSSVRFTSDSDAISNANFIVVTVPTPVTDENRPDLTLLESASSMIGSRLRTRTPGLAVPIIVFESTTYPGCTEDFCGPIVERESGLKSGEGFLLGYSPERTNFGDADHTLESVVKVISGQTEEATDVVSEVYSRIAHAGVHRAPNIKTAEASKVIENVQRDLNIALFNETAMIFDRMGIDSSAVYDAAATKWNFHRYQPGLVGGHCIPVDPYYLTYAAEQVGYSADVILAGRGVNEGMVRRLSKKIAKLVEDTGAIVETTDILVLGQTFKRDVADFRNSKAVALSSHLEQNFGSLTTYDPYVVSSEENQAPFAASKRYGAVVLAVGHSEFVDSQDAIISLVRDGGLLVDLTSSFDGADVEQSNLTFWSI